MNTFTANVPEYTASFVSIDVQSLRCEEPTLKISQTELMLTRGDQTQRILVRDLFNLWPTIQSLLPALRIMTAEMRNTAARRIQRWWTEERFAPPSTKQPRGGPEFRRWLREVKAMPNAVKQ
jgi:hypothetical protein